MDMPKKTEFTITGTCGLTLEHTEGESTSKAKRVDFRIDVSDNISIEGYTTDGLPNKVGCNALLKVFASGITGVIELAIQNGWDTAAGQIEKTLATINEGLLKNEGAGLGTMKTY